MKYVFGYRTTFLFCKVFQAPIASYSTENTSLVPIHIHHLIKYFDYIVDGADEEAIANLVGHAELDQSEGMSRSLKKKSMFMGLPTLVGSYTKIARYLDRIYSEAHVDACMFAFPDFEKDIDTFGEYILPKLESRR